MFRYPLSTILPVLIVTCALALPAVAQERATVHGYVSDASLGETLLSATVMRTSTTVGAATNNDGYYTISRIKLGSYTIVVSWRAVR